MRIKNIISLDVSICRIPRPHLLMIHRHPERSEGSHHILHKYRNQNLPHVTCYLSLVTLLTKFAHASGHLNY